MADESDPTPLSRSERSMTLRMPLGLEYDLPCLDRDQFTSVASTPLPPNGPKIASIFAGCGGLDLGFKWAGYELVYTNEIDKDASRSYEDNLGHEPDCRDVNDVDIDNIPVHDVLIAGFPCQPFSTSGKRMGFEDTRGTLFFNLALILQKKSPPVFLFENVPGLANHDGGHTFRRIKEIIKSSGYELFHTVLNARDFGVPQVRERLFMKRTSAFMNHPLHNS